MNKHIQFAKKYLTKMAGKELTIGVTVVIGLAVLVTVIVLFIQNSGPKLDYQPAVACDLLTSSEAKEMLGEDILGGTPKNPVLSEGVATSKCSYTDMNPDKDKMIVSAIAVRSAVDDEGIKRNKSEFAASMLGKNFETVKDLGDRAYFNPDLGQLNILNERDWIILSYGFGSSPEANTVDKAIELLQKVLFAPELPTF